MDTWTILTQLFAICAIFYWYISKKYTYWSSRGINGPKPLFLFGNMISRGIKSANFLDLEWSKKFGRIYGYYIGTSPTLTVTDANLIKQILVKDFQHFPNRRQLNFCHEIMTEQMFFLDAERWKPLRSITSPTFTSGKLRGLHQLMSKCVDKTEQYFNKITENGPGEMNTKEVIAGFTIDIVASSTFATETNANNESNRSNPFVKNAIEFFNFNPLKLVAMFIFPRFVNDLIGVKYMANNKPTNFFIDFTRQVVRQRMQSKDKRNDLVQLLIDATLDEKVLAETSYDKLTVSMDNKVDKAQQHLANGNNGSIRKMTENEIISQCTLFLVAGFETTASTISHAIFELSQNQDVQERLVQELNLKLESSLDRDSDEYFEKVMTQIPYLEAVIKETLRKYPPVIRLERRLVTDGYKIEKIQLEKDQLIEIPTYAVHHDPEYYPEPERFNPDRFMPENKHLLVPYTYIPFGDGPRNCLGMRFAYQEIKLFLAQILPKYRFDKTSKTPNSLNFKQNIWILLNSEQFPTSVFRRQL